MAILAVGLATDTPELAPLVAAVAVALLAASFLAAAWGRRARARLVLFVHAHPPMGEVGQPMSVSLVVANHSASPAPRLAVVPPAAAWCKQGAPTRSPRRALAPTHLVALGDPGPRGRAAHLFGVPTGRRGVLVLPALPTWVRDPFGLFAAPGPTTSELTVVVHPVPDPSVSWPARTARDDPGEILGIRPYRPGDRLSLLHWPSRARYGAWYVREFAREAATATTVVVDDRAGVHRRADFEALLSVALGLVEEAAHRGGAAELATLTGRRLGVADGPVGLAEVRRQLAALEPRRARGPLAADGVILTTRTGQERLPGTVGRSAVVAVPA